MQPLADLPSIRDTTDISLRALKLNALLDRWVSRFAAPFTTANNPIFSLCCAFTTPWLPLEVQQLGARIWAWITAIDDAFDRDYESLEAVRAAADHCRAVVAGQAPPAADPLALALADIRDQVAGYPAFAELGPLWRRTVTELVDAMELERRWGHALGAGGAPPSLDDYLRAGAATVGIPMYMVSLWATMDRAARPQDVSALLPALQDSALAVRLANDLRSQARERAQEDVNALVLGLGEEQLRRDIAGHVERCREALRPLVARGLGAAVALDRLTVWSTRLYEQIDFRAPGA
jgi:phytoene/squalene synthetase